MLRGCHEGIFARTPRVATKAMLHAVSIARRYAASFRDVGIATSAALYERVLRRVLPPRRVIIRHRRTRGARLRLYPQERDSKGVQRESMRVAMRAQREHPL